MWTGLTLRHAPPRRPASYGDVERLHHHALVAGGDRPVEERRRLVGVGGDDRRQAGARPARPSPGARGARRAARRRRLAAGVQDVEEVRRQPAPAARRRVGAEVAHRVLEAPRRALVVDAEHLAVEHEVAAGQPGDERGDRPEAVGDLVEVAGEEADLARRGGGPGCGRRRASTRPTPGRWPPAPSPTSAAGDASIGCTARPGTMPTARQRLLAAGQRAPGPSRRGRRRACGPGARRRAARPPPWRPRRPSPRRARPGAARRRAPATAAAARARSPGRTGRASSARRAALTPLPDIAARRSIARSTSRIASDGSAAGVDPTSRSVAQPTPMRPCRGAPVRNPTAPSTSSGASRRSTSASSAAFSPRLVVAATVRTPRQPGEQHRHSLAASKTSASHDRDTATV